MTHLLYTIMLLMAWQYGISQIIVCENGSWANKYKVIANDGLKLRAEQRSNSKIVGLIPYGTELSICYENAKTETINGMEGKWAKAFWEGQEAYVFDKYLEKIADTAIFNLFSSDLDLVNDWQYTKFSNKVEYYGLFRTTDKRKFELKRIELAQKDVAFSPPCNPSEVPIWIFDKFPHKADRLLEGKEINKMLYIGEKVQIVRHVLYVSGTLNRENSIDIEKWTLNPYELRVQYQDGKQIKEQLLLKTKFYSGVGGKGSYEVRADVNFIGDLDGDAKEDILITYRHAFNAWSYVLFSTRYAEKRKMFKEMIVGEGTD